MPRKSESAAISKAQGNIDGTTDNVLYTVPRDEIVSALNKTLARSTAQQVAEPPEAIIHRQKVTKKRTTNIASTAPPATTPELIKSFADSAYICECQGRFGEAERLYKQALTLSIRRLGKTNLAIAPHLSSLAALYYLQKRYREAIPLLTSLLNIRQRHQVRYHPEVGETLYRLAQVYYHLYDYRQAEPLFQSALVIFRRAFGPSHARTQAVYCDLMCLIATAIESDKFNEIVAKPPPFDLNTLGETYSWARPSWAKSSEPEENYSWIKLH